MRKPILTLLLSVALGFPCLVWAGPYTNSLWVGTDNTTGLPVLNIDRAGNELRRVDLTEATGIAIDPALNRIYFGVGVGGQITGRNLNDPATIIVTLDPATSFGEDMAFDGSFLWQADISARLVQKIDPNNGNVVLSFDPGFDPLGVAWDGSNLWVSEFAPDGLVEQFTTAGVPTGNQFSAIIGSVVGGLAFDLTDNTLWIGTFGQVFHFTTAGASLGSINVPGRFIDGLEFQAVDNPADVISGPPISTATRIQAAPNPFLSQISVRFTLASVQQIEVAIYDIHGRLVRSLKTGRFEAGAHQLAWDGLDARGNLSGSGVYYIRVMSPGVNLVAKVVRLRF